tara:strand:- start:118 stop:780 length:663 start_codon:yes stop_codon:yes gene_type:complete
MKKLKLIPAFTFILLFVSYYGIYSNYAVSEKFDNLTVQDKITYLSLEENDKIKIIRLEQDSVSVKPDFSDSAKVILTNLSNDKYIAFQGMSEQITTVSEYIFYAKRFLLLIFILVMAYVSYTKKNQFNMAFQKILFENVINGIVFTLFSAVAFLLTQTLRGNFGSASYMFQMLFGDAIETLKYSLIYSILIAILIYFDPRNINWNQKRLARKKKNEEKLS